MTSIDKSGVMPWRNWLALGALLGVVALALRHFSPDFAYEIRNYDMPIIPMVIIYCVSGLLFCFITPIVIKKTPKQHTLNILIFVILSGILMRLASIGVPTILEDDYYRYLWDGAVTASGENPFRYSPVQIQENPALNNILTTLKQQAGEIFERINHPELSTVYPPVAQGIFSLSHWMSPFSLDAWRIILILFELGCIGLIFGILKHLNRSPLWLTLYWWNPIIIKEISNSGHMEPILMLPVLCAAYLILKRKDVWVSVLLGLGAGVKIWPALLTAAVWRQFLLRPRLLIASIVAFIIILAINLWPILLAGLSKTSGFVAFGSEWNASSAIYLISDWFISHLTPETVSEKLGHGLITRGLLGGLLLLAISVICFKKARDEKDVLRRLFLITAAIYLLSPSQTPWYFIWLAPFLCIYPIRGLLLAGALLPLHYSFFYLHARGLEDYYHFGVVWGIWIPVWVLLFYDLVKYYCSIRQKQDNRHATG